MSTPPLTTARGAVLTSVGQAPLIVDDLAVAPPGPGEAVVRITVAGVCGSDLAVRDAKMAYPLPVVLGHEATGVVTALGEPAVTAGTAVALGARVVLWMRPPCRVCRACRRGDAALCESSGVMSARGTLPDGRTAVARGGETVYRAFGIGAFSTDVVMPVGGLVPVPDDVPDEVAALCSCGVATGAGAVLNVAQPRAGDTVVIWGAGGVGLAAAMTAAAVGAAAVVVVDPAEHRRALALALGATAAIPGGDRQALKGQLAEALGGEPADIAIDAVGRPEITELAWRSVRPGGTAVAVGLQEAGAQIVLPAALVPLSQRRLLGCFMGAVDPHRDLPRLFALYRRGVLPVDRLVSDRRPLAEVPAALDDLAAARGLRTVIEVAR